jgi:hypothetical protein
MTDLVNINLKIENNDLVAIKVAKVETDLLNQQETLLAKMNEVKKDLTKTTKELEKAAQALAEAHFAPVREAVKVMKDVFPATVKVACEFRNDKKKLSAVCRLDQGNYNNITKETEIEINGDVLALIKKTEDLNDALTKVSEELIKIKRGLGMISTLERQARAKLATETLSRTEEGQKILSSLDQIAGLPKLIG